MKRADERAAEVIRRVRDRNYRTLEELENRIAHEIREAVQLEREACMGLAKDQPAIAREIAARSIQDNPLELGYGPQENAPARVYRLPGPRPGGRSKPEDMEGYEDGDEDSETPEVSFDTKGSHGLGGSDRPARAARPGRELPESEDLDEARELEDAESEAE